MLIKTNKGLILGFDIENMPLTYYVPDYPTARITAIGMMLGKHTHVCVIDPVGGTGCTPQEMAEHFLERYNEATLVTGHYIRKHDLPHINAMLFELGMSPLGPKNTSDTKDDVPTWKGLPKNLEYLAAQLEVKTAKKHMTQKDWREANMFTPAGLSATTERVKKDVIAQLQLRKALIDGGWLKPPKIWTP
jgi:hypothetical protein